MEVASIGEWSNEALEQELASTMGVIGASQADFSGRLVTYMDVAKRRVAETNEYDGDKVLQSIELTFRKLDVPGMFPRSQLQKEIHKHYTIAVMHHIYGPTAFQSKSTELKILLGIDAFEPRVALTMPRRCGKTQSMAQFNAVMLICARKDIVIDVFSSCERASKMLLKLTYSILAKLSKEAAAEITVNNAESLQLWNSDIRALRVLNSYPGGVCVHIFSFFYSRDRM
jgi:hypothetical protein